MGEGFFFWGLLIGWLWAGWFADRGAGEKTDPAMLLLCVMLAEVEQKRRLVGRGLTITRAEILKIKGETYTLSLASKGDATWVKETA